MKVMDKVPAKPATAGSDMKSSNKQNKGIIMTTTYIQPKNNQRSKLISFLSKHLRNFEQKLQQTIIEEATNTEEIKILFNKEENKEVNFQEIAINLPMLLKSAIKTKFGKISGTDLTQDLVIEFSTNEFCKNCNLFLAGNTNSAFTYEEDLDFLHRISTAITADFIFKLHWTEGDGFMVAVEAPRMKRPNWLEETLINSSSVLEDKFNGLCEYLEGRIQ